MLHRCARVVAVVLTIVIGGALAAPANAQCTTSWQGTMSLPGVAGVVHAMATWDPDGAGPATPVVVVGGKYTTAGSVATSLASYDPASGAWEALGELSNPGDHEVKAVTVLPNGDLVVGGNFRTIDGVAVNGIARRSGVTWVPLGTGLQGWVNSLAVAANGDLIAGGVFEITIGSIDLVARWNGTTWSSLGLGAPHMSNEVRALAVMQNGDVVAGGWFWNAFGASFGCLVRWDGSSWSLLGGAMDGYVNALIVAPNGDLIAGGLFSSAGGVPVETVARWNGVTWSAVGPSPFDWHAVRALALMPNGDLVAGGDDSGFASCVRQWNGTAWSSLGWISGHQSVVQSLAVLPNGELLAGGDFDIDIAGPVGVSSVARWSGASWSPLGTGFCGTVRATATMPNGHLVVGGGFVSIGAVVTHSVAMHDGTNWSQMGTGLPWGKVNALVALPNGDVVAAGAGFDIPGAVPDAIIARWDGTTWHALPSPPPGGYSEVRALAVMPNGDIVAGGGFGVSRWTAAGWAYLYPGDVRALHVLANGDLIVADWLVVRRFDGSTWSTLGGAFINGVVRTLAALPNGDLIAGGTFTSVGGVATRGLARWDGVAWRALGGLSDARIEALEVLPNGDLAVGGQFTADAAAPMVSIGRWDGANWSPMPPLSRGPVVSLEMIGTELVVGGGFTAAGSVGVSCFARLATNCPATVIASSSGCSGAGGANVLSATSLPWSGGMFTAEATGMPALGIALSITGFGSASVPLSALLPQGGAGCFLLTTPDIVGAAVPAGGVTTTSLAIPASAGLVGVVFHQQVLPLELDSLGAIVAFTSTNRLTALIGSF